MKKKKRKIFLLIVPCVILLAFIGCGVFAGIITLTKSQKEPMVFYNSIEELVAAWGDLHKTEGNERCAIIMSRQQNNERVYFIKRTYTGKSDNVKSEFFAAYFNYGLSCLFSANRMEGWVHTHPIKTPNPFRPTEQASETDIFCLYLAGIRSGYIVFPSGEAVQYFKTNECITINDIDG